MQETKIPSTIAWNNGEVGEIRNLGKECGQNE
jgi:hypothetical protein